MIGALFARVIERLRRGDDDRDGDSTHAGSLLDASVNYAHGHKDAQNGVRELQKIDEEASRLRDADDRGR